MSAQEVGAADVGGSAAPSATIPDSGNIPEAVAADFVAMWGELGNVRKSKTANAGTYTYSYADLGDLLDVARPILAKHGFALIQPLSRDGQPTVTISTMLIHRSGHVLRWPFDVQPGNSPQQTGSAVTYGRRYAAASALGVAYEGDDDDGAAATKAAPATPPRARVIPPPATAEEARRRRAFSLFTTLGIVDRDHRLAETSRIIGRVAGSWNDLDDNEQDRVIDVLEERLAEMSDE